MQWETCTGTIRWCEHVLNGSLRGFLTLVLDGNLGNRKACIGRLSRSVLVHCLALCFCWFFLLGYVRDGMLLERRTSTGSDCLQAGPHRFRQQNKPIKMENCKFISYSAFHVPAKTHPTPQPYVCFISFFGTAGFLQVNHSNNLLVPKATRLITEKKEFTRSPLSKNRTGLYFSGTASSLRLTRSYVLRTFAW